MSLDMRTTVVMLMISSSVAFLVRHRSRDEQTLHRFGHQGRDLALTAFAAVLKRCIRTHDLPARYGGEEFCVLLAGTDLPEARAVAERIRAAVAGRPLADLPEPVTVSIGVGPCQAGAISSLDAAIHLADEALYRAKHSGRNRVESAWTHLPRQPVRLAAV